MKARIALGLAAFLFGAAMVWGYSREGHQAIAELARARLSPQARAEVVKLLGNDDLASVAAWLDDVRAAERHQGNLMHDPAAADFIRRFPESKDWHFVDFPVGATAYDSSSPFATTNDAVHALALAINTLEGKATGLTKAEALKVIVHLVGDIHQPLHTVSGYYDLTSPAAPHLLSPSEATIGSSQDAGGNALFYFKLQELHALWDTGLLLRVSPKKDYKSLAHDCERLNPQVARDAPSGGDYHDWPTSWASESITIGTAAYARIQFGPAATSPGRGRSLRMHKITITLPPDYEATQAPVDARQIALAGVRLALLLEAVHWTD